MHRRAQETKIVASSLAPADDMVMAALDAVAKRLYGHEGKLREFQVDCLRKLLTNHHPSGMVCVCKSGYKESTPPACPRPHPRLPDGDHEDDGDGLAALGSVQGRRDVTPARAAEASFSLSFHKEAFC